MGINKAEYEIRTNLHSAFKEGDLTLWQALEMVSQAYETATGGVRLDDNQGEVEPKIKKALRKLNLLMYQVQRWAL